MEAFKLSKVNWSEDKPDAVVGQQQPAYG
jgi:hypothetical protein